MIGLSGKSNDDPKLKQMLKDFKIYSSKMKIEGDESEEYTMDHTIIAYLMNSNNQFVTHLGSSMGVHDLANYVVRNIIDDLQTFD